MLIYSSKNIFIDMEEDQEKIEEAVEEVHKPETSEESALKSSTVLLEEIFDAFLSESSKKKKSKHKKKEKHKKKKKHKDSDREKKEKRKHRSSEKSSSKKEEKPDSFYVAPDNAAIPKNLDTGVKFDASKCDLYAAGELDSEEEKALSFDCFVETESPDEFAENAEKNGQKRSSSLVDDHEGI